MAILYSEAKKILAKYVGSGGVCPTNPEVDLFTRQVLEYLLFSDTYGSIHKFRFCAVNGCITLPYELEVPLKVKIDGIVGSVWDRWYEFHQSKILDNCLPASRALIEDPNYYPTIYDSPGPQRIGVVGHAKEAADAHVVIKGKDATGREIITSHNGKQVVGEYLQIKCNELKYTNAQFAEVTSVVKTPTVGYTTLYWVNQTNNLKGFLADYTPLETVPQYRRYRLTQPCCKEGHQVTVLGKVRLKPAYADNDLIPFDNIFALNLAGQTVNAYNNRAPGLGQATGQMLDNVISRESEYKKVDNGQPIEVYLPTSGGMVKNIIGNWMGGWGNWSRR